MDNQTFIKALSGVSSTQLKIFDLAAEMIAPEGNLDQQVARSRSVELKEAIKEAEIYAGATRRLRKALGCKLENLPRYHY